MRRTVVAQALAPRIAEKIASYKSVFIKAPCEFLPIEIATQAMSTLYGCDGYLHVPVLTDPKSALETVKSTLPRLVTLKLDDHGGLLEPWQPETKLRNLWRKGSPSQGRQVVFVLEGDEVPEVVETIPDGLTLDHAALVATLEEVVAVHPAAENPDLLQTVIEVTGCVPGLLTHPIENERDLLDYRAAVRSATLPWAERVYPQVVADSLLSLSVWSGRLSADTRSALARAALNLEIPPPEVRRLQAGTLFTAVNSHQPGMPDALAGSLGQLMLTRDRSEHDTIRMSLARVACADQVMRGLDRIKLLVSMGEWSSLEQVLASKLHLLATMNGPQRTQLLSAIPEAVSRRYARISTARDFLLGRWSHPQVPAGLPTPWGELFHLALAEEPSDPNTVKGQARERISQWLGHKPLDLLAARSDVTTVVKWLGDVAHTIEARQACDRCDDELACVVTMLFGGADAMAVLGELGLAQACVRQALRLVGGQGASLETYPSLLVSALARSAFLAAASGLVGSTEARLAEYHHAYAEHGEPDADAARQVEIAGKYAQLSAIGIKNERTKASLNPDAMFAPHEGEAEALRVLLFYGLPAGIDWLTGGVSRVAPSSRAPWEWWPLHAILALAEARLGRPGRAQQWLERSPLPPALDLCVRANIELAAGRTKTARNLADHVLNAVDVPVRWRLLAAGVKLACVDPQSPSDCAQREVLLDSEDWDELLGVIVLWPDVSRAMVLPKLEPHARKLSGLEVAQAPEEAGRDVRLTPRQVEILEALSTGMTMTEIAKRFYLGPETVRSTAKQMYRRLGVHDRDSAVQLGRALGLI